jgi:tetratricopeptide (TPR) repeat protein
MHLRVIALVMCGALQLSAAHGADTVQYGPAPDWVRPIARPTDDGTMAQAPSKILYRSHQLRFTATGLETYAETFVRLQTAQGLQSFGSIALPWKPETDVLTVNKFHLIRGDKVIDLLAAGQKFEVLRRENNLEYSALDGTLTAALQPSGMEVGDLVDFAFTIQHQQPLSFSPEYILAGFDLVPISRVEVRATWDKSLPLQWRATEEIKGVKTSQNGNQVELTWSADNLGPITQPTNMPMRFWHEPRIVFASSPTWNDLSRKLAPLYTDAAQIEAGSPLMAEAKKIAASATDPVARLEAALKLTQDQVRYVYLGMGDGSVKPANADETWKRRFGDCKAKSALLVGLLRELKIPADVVAVNTTMGDMLGDQLPILGGFDHVIVRAAVGGKKYWLDGTGSGSWRRADMAMPNYHWGLPLTERGDGLLRMLAEPAAEPQVEVSTFIDAKAGLHTDAPFKAQTRLRGVHGALLNGRLSALAPAELETALRQYWKDQYAFVEVGKVSAAYDTATGIETISLEGTADMDWGDYRYTTDGLRTGLFASFARDPGINVDAPFAQEHPSYMVTKQRIELPEVGTFTTKGKNYDLTLAGAHFVRRAKIENRVFTGESSRRSLASEIPASDARAAEKQLNDMWRDKLEIVASNYSVTDSDVAALKTRKYTTADHLVWRGNILLDRGQYEAAFSDFDAAVKLDDKNYNALAHRGLANLWKRDDVKAKADLDAVLAAEPNNAVALRGLGVFHRHRGENSQAVERLTASLAVQPDNSYALGNRAYAYAANADDDKALADAATAIKLNPSYVDMFDLRAWILSKREDQTPAIQELKAMLAANPNSTAALESAARVYARMGLYPQALAAADRVVAKSPTAASYFGRAAARDPDDLVGRLADIDLGLAKKPDDKRAMYERGRLLSQSGDHKGAIAVYTKLLEMDTDAYNRRFALTYRGIEYTRDGNSALASKDLSAALANKPSADSYNNFCWELAEARVQLTLALAACEKALGMDAKAAEFLDSKGFVLLQLGRFGDAIAAYDAALALKPRLAASLYGRGVAKKRICHCDAGNADLKAGRLDDPTVVRTFARAGLAP